MGDGSQGSFRPRKKFKGSLERHVLLGIVYKRYTQTEIAEHFPDGAAEELIEEAERVSRSARYPYPMNNLDRVTAPFVEDGGHPNRIDGPKDRRISQVGVPIDSDFKPL